MATLDDAESFLVSVESSIKDLKEKYDSKQSERLLASHVWMSDHLERNVKGKVISLKDALSVIKDKHVGDFKSTTQFDAVIAHCNDIINLLDSINTMYKIRAGIVDIRLKWQYNMPQILERTKSMRNRLNIIRGQISRKQFEYEERDSWL